MTDTKDEARDAIVADQVVADGPDHDITSELESEDSGSESPKGPIPLWKKAVAVGAWIVAAFALTVAFGVLRGDPPADNTVVPLAIAPAETAEAPANSLGIRFDEVRELWNSVDPPPSISSALRRLPETGELDSFVHRFSSGAVLAGAYQDSNDYLVAVVVRAKLSNPDVSTMYLHICHLAHPFSPECIDNYFTSGMEGQTLEDLTATGHSATWEYEGNEWRVTVADDELAIRVLAPESN